VDKNGVLGESSKALGRIAAVVAEAVLSKAPESFTSEDTERPSATAIMIGMGLVGWAVG
jgi:glutamine synthetase adenylyltransferase